MKPPRSLKIIDQTVGSGRPCVPGDVALCRYACTRRKGDILFASDTAHPIRVGARDGCVGMEYGLMGMRIGGRRTVTVAPNLTYVERKTYPELPDDTMLIYDLALDGFGDKWDPDMDRRLTDRASQTGG